MNTLFVCLLASVLVVYGSEDNLQESKQQETSCVNYCSNIINPMLNVTRNLRNQVNDFKNQTKCLSQFENTNKLMEKKFASQDKKIEQKLRDLNTTSEQILQQINLQGKQVEQQLEVVKKLIPGPPYQQIGSKYYYIEKSEKVNWFGAVHKCLAMDGHLVNIQNVVEFNAIKQKLQNREDYWIDINVLANKDEYTSISTGWKANFFMWQSGEPNKINGNNCCKLNSSREFKMRLDACSYKQLFICEFRN
ncbi:C-type lectin domain family 3 member A-like [Drosophila sulfurigaster albostrigata]|uniref:C-type lectin domain family 3 member A-like n=1 Tax=Drosophila sulfurigaster albostrigata TaxID=89887 RepID=UPI002D21D151|nr:C-type lectin domain family 3 member A-like [Drosophila sulfurigaster albostrigata]